MRITLASDSALFITFGDGISVETSRQVIALFRALERLRDHRIRNLHPAYSSLLIDFDPLSASHQELEGVVLSLESQSETLQQEASQLIEIPVCYDPEYGPDLMFVAQHAQLTEEQVIAMHSTGEYSVCFLGFSPGFAYLGGLCSQLHVPRRATPRKHVAAGSLGIAGGQTGIYPNDSPGGWQLIGRIPLRMFDPAVDPPSRLRPGDRVQFRRINRQEFDQLSLQKEQRR